jgi:hypothetical protein
MCSTVNELMRNHYPQSFVMIVARSGMEEPQEEAFVKQVRLDWRVPEHIRTQYATNFAVTHGEHEFYMLFFELQKPVLLGEPEEIRAQIEQIETVPVECIARIAMSAERIQAVIDALQEHLEKYNRRKEFE